MLNRVKRSLKLTTDELLYKVTWPSWEQLQSSAIVTLVASLIIALMIFIMDSAFENIFKVFYTIFE